MGKIKIVVVDGLNADDVLKLKHGGFFDGVGIPLPQGAVGQEAVLVTPVAATPSAPVASGYDANAREAVEQAEAKQEAAVEKKPRKKVEASVEEPIVAQPAKVVPLTAAEREAALPDPVGNGKKHAAKHARKGGRYVVFSLGRKWEATFEGPSKAGLKFLLVHKDEPHLVNVDDGALVEEMDTTDAAPPEDEQAQDVSDVDLSVETLLGFTKLRDLIQYVVTSGIDPAGVAAFCESIKDEVPLLQRITNIEERVGRTLEVMGYSEAK